VHAGHHLPRFLSLSSADPSSLLDETVSEIAAEMDAQLLATREITVAGFPGLRASAAAQEGDLDLVVHWSVVLYRGKTIQLQLSCRKGLTPFEDIERFLGSLRLE
jgi:hypothetical protein